MSDLKNVVLEVAEEILGLPSEDMIENMDMDLWDEGLLDSVSFASLIAYIEERIHQTIDIQKINPADFKSLNTIISAIERVIK